MNNYERIKNMTVDEMNEFLYDVSCCDTCTCEMEENSCMAVGCKEGNLRWLLSEVEE